VKREGVGWANWVPSDGIWRNSCLTPHMGKGQAFTMFKEQKTRLAGARGGESTAPCLATPESDPPPPKGHWQQPVPRQALG